MREGKRVILHPGLSESECCLAMTPDGEIEIYYCSLDLWFEYSRNEVEQNMEWMLNATLSSDWEVVEE
jgi:hypothetical protein